MIMQYMSAIKSITCVTDKEGSATKILKNLKLYRI